MSGREGRGVVMLSSPVIVCGTFLAISQKWLPSIDKKLTRVLDNGIMNLNTGVPRPPA